MHWETRRRFQDFRIKSEYSIISPEETERNPSVDFFGNSLRTPGKAGSLALGSSPRYGGGNLLLIFFNAEYGPFSGGARASETKSCLIQLHPEQI